jgi:hypothetical protein
MIMSKRYGGTMKKITVHQAAKEYGLTPRQIYYAIATNKIKADRIADVYWISRKQIEKLKGKE